MHFMGRYTKSDGLASREAGSLALAFCHSCDGQSLAAERAGEQPLQSFDLAPAAHLGCLDDTRLQPSYLPFASFPVDLVPMFHGG
jgi:hypothetical protein